jgi:hypothetical protein
MRVRRETSESGQGRVLVHFMDGSTDRKSGGVPVYGPRPRGLGSTHKGRIRGRENATRVDHN